MIAFILPLTGHIFENKLIENNSEELQISRFVYPAINM